MATKTTRADSDEGEIRRLIDGWIKATHAKDAEAAVSHYAPDLLSYDLAPPLVHRGAEHAREQLQGWFATFEGPVGCEVRDLAVTQGGDVAFSTSLNRITGRRTFGEETDVWVRVTLCFRKTNGAWQVVHEHVSVPFYMDGSYKAAVDLAP